MKKLSVGIGTALVLVVVMLGLLLAPVTQKNDGGAQADTRVRNARFRGIFNLGLFVTVESPKKISLGGPALGNESVTVGSVEEFSRVARRLDGPGTAVVFASLGGAEDGELVEMAVTKRKLQRILSEHGFHDPTTE